jgi:hypothetical protein
MMLRPLEEIMLCKKCNQTLHIHDFSKSRIPHRICRSCDRKNSLQYQKKRQTHCQYRSIWKVKSSLRKLRKMGVQVSKTSWLKVDDYERFLIKWNHKSALTASCPTSCSSGEICKNQDLVFWFPRINDVLSFENAFPCTLPELDTIVEKANGSVKMGVYLLTHGDAEKSREILERLDPPFVINTVTMV